MNDKTKAINMADLPPAYSRVENYLDYLCGRATSLVDLPKPQSRVEHFLEYLCHNGGIGGGNPNPPFVGIIDAELINDRTLHFTLSDGSIKDIDLENLDLDFVNDWEDLSHTVRITKQNIFNPSDHVIKGSYYYNFDNGNIRDDNTGTWARTVIPFTPGTIYTVYKTKHISQVFVFLNEDGVVVDMTKMSGTTMNGNTFTKRYKIDTNNVPQGAVAFGFNIVIDKNNSDYIDVNHNVMVFAEELTQGFDDFIPYTNGAEIVVDGSEVSIEFDSNGTNIMANTVNGALQDLDKRIFNAGITLNNKVDRAELSQTSLANKVPQLDNNGKLHSSMLPDLSINQVYSVQDQQGAMDLINNQTASVGDVFIIRGQANAVYMYVNEQGTNFSDKCSELTLGAGVVKVVNDQVADSTGSVRVYANQITLSDRRTILEDELNLKLKSINGQTGTNGNIDLEVDKTGVNGINFKAGNATFGTVTYITDAQVQEIKNLFV